MLCLLLPLSGPWHSESGLDRNVDPMEDSYVKKIISSNEGLNFNKDMAEAGGNLAAFTWKPIAMHF